MWLSWWMWHFDLLYIPCILSITNNYHMFLHKFQILEHFSTFLTLQVFLQVVKFCLCVSFSEQSSHTSSFSKTFFYRWSYLKFDRFSQVMVPKTFTGHGAQDFQRSWYPRLSQVMLPKTFIGNGTQDFHRLWYPKVSQVILPNTFTGQGNQGSKN